VRYYPFILGAQPVRMIDLAAFYAAVANEGARPQPHGIDSIEADGKTIYEYPKTPLPMIGAADRVSFYQLKTMLQGVVARGTARAIGALSPYVAGKTGTTEDAVDGWFVGFTNDVTVAVWVGYDNGDGKRRSLGSNATGARVALPIFQPILESIWAEHIAPKAPLNGPSPDARRLLVDIPIDYASGDRVAAGTTTGGGFVEHFRRGAGGQIEDTQYQLVSRESAYAASGYQGDNQWSWGNFFGGPTYNGQWGGGRSYYPNQRWQTQPQQPPPSRGIFGLFQPWTQQPQPQRDNSWGGRVN
jgi:membrane carboxypeptidase/penicillin-binding protein